ncbi:hypothetical protein ABT063_10355 [Streptomyces sp. NPDC002838]|uniref:hypothetical protein n=1 Tax=Streptomyces sp. NPDC002838 TaxID=3154436 RepID=UPI00332DDA40
MLVLHGGLAPEVRDRAGEAAVRLVATDRTTGRDRSVDGKDGFHGAVALDDAFLPLVANPVVLPTLVALLSPNIHLLSSNLIAMPSLPSLASSATFVPDTGSSRSAGRPGVACQPCRWRRPALAGHGRRRDGPGLPPAQGPDQGGPSRHG